MNMEKVKAKTIKINGEKYKVEVYLGDSKDFYYSICPRNGAASCGNTVEDAVENLKEFIERRL